MNIIAQRLGKVRRIIKGKGLDCLVVSQADNRRYLSGFTGSAGTLIISPKQALLATDFRYVEQAKLQAPQFEVVQIKGELANWLPSLPQLAGIHLLGFEADDLSYAASSQLDQALASSPIKLMPTTGLVMELRAIKDAQEMKLAQRALALADAAFAHLPKFLRPGLAETAVAWELERFLREKGSQAMPFDVIVASGPNAALPHHQPSERPIQRGEPIIIDLGAKVDGYGCDLTRTVCLGAPDDTYRKVYKIVRDAQRNAIDRVRAGMTGAEADALGRDIIEKADLGDAFGHGLGHGIGLATHEDPRLGPGSQAELAPGMFFSIEPGIYLPGWGGIRLEDDVFLAPQGGQVMSQASRKRWVGMDNSVIPVS